MLLNYYEILLIFSNNRERKEIPVPFLRIEIPVLIYILKTRISMVIYVTINNNK